MGKAAFKSFRATLELMPSSLNWTIIRIPFDVAKTWGKRGQLRVKGEINGFAFRSALFATGAGKHILIVNKKMQAGAGARIGSQASFCLEPDKEERVVAPQAELFRVLGQAPGLRRWFDALSHAMRSEIVKWIDGVKSSEARKRRAEQIAERLLATMEAERELPPVLQVAFARDPRARTGWESMSQTHRRRHLMGIFGYRSPESRARRLEKMIEDAIQRAEKKRK